MTDSRDVIVFCEWVCRSSGPGQLSVLPCLAQVRISGVLVYCLVLPLLHLSTRQALVSHSVSQYQYSVLTPAYLAFVLPAPVKLRTVLYQYTPVPFAHRVWLSLPHHTTPHQHLHITLLCRHRLFTIPRALPQVAEVRTRLDEKGLGG